MTHRFISYFLAFAAIAYLAFGVWGLVHGQSMWALLSVGALDANGAYELTAVYGGINLLLGLLAAIALFKPQLQTTALIAAGINVAGLATGRAYALLFMESPAAWMIGVMVAELILAGIAFWLPQRSEDLRPTLRYSAAP